jgi:O-methyltransferase involved in polyketide biosynthesis
MNIKPIKTHKIDLTKEELTLLITLYAKALDYRSENSILNDKTADDLVNSIEYDFEKLKKNGIGNYIAVRAKQYDEWIQEFLEVNPDAVIVQLGCGLDTRITRINPPLSVSWFDIDYPSVIRLRGNFFSNQSGYTMIGSSVTNADWLTKIPKDRPVIIIAEGVLEYLVENDVKSLINRLTDYFIHGQIAFDVMNSFAINSGRPGLEETTGAVHKWAVDAVHEVDKLDPKLKRISCLRLFGSKYIHKLPLKYRLVYGVMNFIPPFRNMICLLRYEF